MGCWNETCGLTSLPIHAGEEIIVFILRRMESASGGKSYAYNDDYAPVCLPFAAKYNECGAFEDVENEKFLLNELHRFDFYYREDIDEEQYKKVELDNIEIFINEYMYLYVNFNNKKHSVSIWMCHKGIYEALLNSISNRKVYNATYNLYERNRRIIEQYLQEARGYVNYGIKYDDEDYARRSIQFYVRNVDVTAQYFYEMAVEDHTDYVAQLTEYLCFCWVLNLLRKGFYVQTGTGSQSDELYLHKIMSEWVMKYIETKKQSAFLDSEKEQRSDFGSEHIYEYLG